MTTIPNRILWKFFFALAFLTVLAVFVLNFFVSLKLRDTFEQRITDRLRTNAILVGDILTDELLNGPSLAVRDKTDTIARQLDLRITIIDPNGTVLADSDTDPTHMDNHADRTEVALAIDTGFGQSTRRSKTLTRDMKYVAVRIDEGDNIRGVVRFAVPLSEVQIEMRLIYRIVLLAACVAVVLALIVAYFVSKSITAPITEMTETAQRIAQGDFSRKARVRRSDELGQLAQALNTMSEELQQKLENLRKMDRMRTDFVANVSHELKTPLTLIRGYIETLQDKALGDPEKAPRFVAIIKDHAERLGNIIDDLLSLSELELSKDSLHRTTFDLKQLVDDVKLGFGHALDVKSQTLSVKAQGDDFDILGDHEKIEQIFVNLIDNAIKYTPDNGRVTVSLTAQADHIRAAVADNGIGIPKKDVERVFERFYRVDKARSRQVGGTGLGLGIAKHIVLAHNGEIDIDSRLDEGTTISISLPRR